MSARQRRFWWAAGILCALAGGVSLVYVWVTNSVTGRSWLLTTVVSQIEGAFKGRGHLRVGTMREVGWGRIEMDSVAIVDTAGVPVIRIDHLVGRLDVFALRFRVVHVRALDVTGVHLDLRKDLTRPWNVSYIISGDTTSRRGGGPGFGDNIRIDTLRLSDGTITTIAPWEPYPVFTGAARDSVIALRDSLHDLVRTPAGMFERRTITLDRVVAHNGIITQPGRKPSSMVIDSLRGIISDPPLHVTAAAGHVQWTPDSLRIDLPKVTLPASVGSVRGRVWWHQPGAVRYDVVLKTTAGLSDLAWVWDVLPAAGAGRSTVRMRTLESADDAEFTLSDLDVTSGSSHVAGRITVVARPAELLLQKVDLFFAPLSSELMRRLSYGVVPTAVKGMMTGRLVAETGGPLKRFLIDRLDARFVDAVVPGAVSSLRAAGLVTMGAAPAAQNVRIAAMQLDLRTARALAPTLPKVDGIVTASGLIVSANLHAADTRGLSVLWTDAAGNISRMTGNARIGYGLKVPSIAVDLAFDPISMRALARIDTTLGLRSNIAGRVIANGMLDSLAWRASLNADSSSATVLEGTASIQRSSSSRGAAMAWRGTAAGRIDAFNARAWIGRADVPATALFGTLGAAFAGTRDSAGIVFVDEVHADVNLRQAEANERPAFDLLATGGLNQQRFHLDSSTMHLGGVTLEAHGALARNGRLAIVDTIEVSARADTLELVRRQLSRLAATIAPLDSSSAASLRAFAADTLKGDASVSGYLFGSLDDFNATLALGARNVQVGAIHVGRIFGSLQADSVLTRAFFEGVATADDIDGIGAARIASTEFRVQRASPDSGRLVLDASSVNNAHLVIRGGYVRADQRTTVTADSLRFVYDSVTWRSAAPFRVVSDVAGLRVDSIELRSSNRGLVALRADVPMRGPVSGRARLERFPVGEAVAFALGTRRFSGLLTGDAALSGTRAEPLIDWHIDGDSLGVDGNYLPRVVTQGKYANRKLVAEAVVTDSLKGSLRAEARVPVDLSIAKVEKRLLSDRVDADVTADSLRLDALGVTVAGVSRIRGIATGRVTVSGPMDRPVATGTMTLDNFSAFLEQLGIAPYEGRAFIRAAQDSLILESFRIRSGRASDTLSVRGALRFAKGEPIRMVAQVTANTVILAQQKDGTELVLSGALAASGTLLNPIVTGSVFIPSATIFFDPLGASTAVDLTAASAREYLLPSEVPTIQNSSKSIAKLGQFATVNNVRVELGNEVWVRTPEATVRLTGNVDLNTIGDALVPEGEITANRGQYLLNLGVALNRSFSIDSGRVRFFGDPDLSPTLDISATNVVRLATAGDEIPIRVHVGGTIDRPIVTLSSTDPLYSAAPESEIISLLIFGAPTFALDGQSQSTVRAVAGVLLPSAGGVVAGQLQRLLPVFNTVQVTTAGGQSDLTNASSLLDNLSISAGKQIGTRTFLRLNTGVCRGNTQSTLRLSSLWYGISTEYRLAHGYLAQAGVDPGSAPCSRLAGDLFPRMQFGFDLFREWVF